MRARDNPEARFNRIGARFLKRDFAGALEECDKAEAAFAKQGFKDSGIDLYRGLIHTFSENVIEAQVALEKVKIHHIMCPDRYCQAQIAYPLLSLNAYFNAGRIDEAFYHINEHLRIEPEEISSLWWRGTVLQELWQNQTGNNELLEKAVIDFRKAYALIQNLPDDQYYRLKIMRDIENIEVMEKRCQDTYRMSEVITILEISGAQTVDKGPANDFFNDCLNSFHPSKGVHTPAWEIHIPVGCDLFFLLEKTEGDPVERVEVLDGIEPLVEQHGDAKLLMGILSLSSKANLDVYEIHGDVEYLYAAEKKLADLQRLCNTEELNEMREDIEKIRTEISKFINALDA